MMTIRLMTVRDNQETMKFLSREPDFNLFIIGDIENFGYDQDFQTLWGCFNRQGEIEGVLLRFYDSFIVYSYHQEVLKCFSSIIYASDKARVLSGKKEVIDLIKGYLPQARKLRREYFAHLEELNTDLVFTSDIEIKKAGVDDLDRLIDCLDSIEEFSELPVNREAKEREFRNETGRAYFVEDKKGRIISTAGTAAESSSAAMVIAVATLPEYRGRGLATRCVYRLCQDLLEEGKTPCLFYDNTEAGKIYRQIGFTEIGSWNMVHLDQISGKF